VAPMCGYESDSRRRARPEWIWSDAAV
jgi:hypothetical protein